MFGKKKKENTIYGIIGLGRFGMALAKELAVSGADILALDQNEEKILEIREYTENALVVHKLDKKTLEEAGIADCDIVIICIGSHIETSILTALNLNSLGVPMVIAKATSVEQGEILERLGAEVVYPERDMAIRLANRLETSRVLDFIQLSEKIAISKVVVPEKFIKKSVSQINVRAKYGINIIAVENDGVVTEMIGADYVFKSGDVMIVSGSNEAVLRLAE